MDAGGLWRVVLGAGFALGMTAQPGLATALPSLPLAQSLSVVANATPNSASPSGPLCSAQLPQAIAQIIEQPEFQRSRWGVLVQTLPRTGQQPTTLYARDAQQFFIPASNAKLFTTAAALQRLGPQFRMRTPLYSTGTEVWVQGQGDPSLSDAQLRTLAQQLRQKGVSQISRLMGDDSFFRGSATHPNWEWEDIQAGYGSPVNSLILNQNAVGFQLVPQGLGQPLRVVWDDPSQASRWRVENQSVTVATTEPEFIKVGRDVRQPIARVSGQLHVGSAAEPTAVAVLDPAEHFLQRFRQVLAAEKITVGSSFVSPTPRSDTAVEVAAVESPPLSELLVEANRESNNLYTESLLRSLGAIHRPNEEALIGGRTVVKETLTALGVNPDGYVLADGSGLSRHNLASPEALVQTLIANSNSAVFLNSLAVAGTNGTLSTRFRNTPAQGRLQGKTGSLGGVATLSGYLNPPSYPQVVFSIMVNQSDQPRANIHRAIDSIVLLLTRLQAC